MVIDAIYIESVKKNTDINSSSTHRKYNNSRYKTIKIKSNGKTKILTGKNEKVTDYYQEEEEEKVEQIVRE